MLLKYIIPNELYRTEQLLSSSKYWSLRLMQKTNIKYATNNCSPPNGCNSWLG